MLFKYLNSCMKIAVGKMKFSSRRMKGVSERSFLPIKVPFSKDSSHAEVLEKCISRVSLNRHFVTIFTFLATIRYGVMHPRGNVF